MKDLASSVGFRRFGASLILLPLIMLTSCKSGSSGVSSGGVNYGTWLYDAKTITIENGYKIITTYTDTSTSVLSYYLHSESCISVRTNDKGQGALFSNVTYYIYHK